MRGSRSQRRVVAKPIERELGRVVAPWRRAIDEQIAAAVAAHVTERDGSFPRGYLPNCHAGKF